MGKEKKESQQKPKRKRGRPPLQMPEPIDADPSSVVRAAFRVNTKAPGFEWQYQKKDKKDEKGA